MASSSSTSLPTYVSLSTVNVGNFVTLKLCGDKHSNNYSSWKVQMLSLINSQDLLSFIDGRTNPPLAVHDKNISTEEYNLWRTDMTIRGWILATVSEPRLLTAVADLTTARQVWLQLESIFTQPSYSRTKSKAHMECGEYNTGVERIAAEGLKLMLLETNSEEFKKEINEILQGKPPTAVMSLLESCIGQKNNIVVLDVLLSTNISLLELKNHQGATLLHLAAAVGNRRIAKTLVEKCKDLCYVEDRSRDFPIHYAALHEQKDVIRYLLSVPRDDKSADPYASASGLKLVLYLIEAHYFDIAIDLVEHHPELALYKDSHGNSALTQVVVCWHTIRLKSSPRLTSKLISKLMNFIEKSREQRDIAIDLVEHHPELALYKNSHGNSALTQVVVCWHTIRRLTPKLISKLMNFIEKSREQRDLLNISWRIKISKKRRKAYEQAIKLVRLLSKKIRTSDNIELFGEAFVKAAEFHHEEVVVLLVETFPEFFCINCVPSMQYLVIASVESHCLPLMRLIYGISNHKYLYSKPMDSNNNNVLHLAAKLAPSHRLDRITGAALQMQYELKWFEFVRSIVHPYARLQRNHMGQTPAMVFLEQHSNLKSDGEKWMKETANSCTIAAALIATIMFAAAITVPGGNDPSDNGYPLFANKKLFTLFAISDALSLFSSIVSLLMFLYILTSRYEVKDFLDILPRTLLTGLASLFFSITFMMMSFSVALYFVFGQQRGWVLSTSMVFAFVPIIVFVRLQSRILVDLYRVFRHWEF